MSEHMFRPECPSNDGVIAFIGVLSALSRLNTGLRPLADDRDPTVAQQTRRPTNE